MGSFKNIAGVRYGKRVAVQFVGQNKWGQGLWRCRCDCGTEGVTSIVSLRRAASCGCLQRAAAVVARTKHGHSTRRTGTTRTYRIWQGMLTRCGNPNAPQWKNHGGRGISVCESWRGSYAAFLSDMGECPGNLTLDRIDNDGNYEKSNCRWATHGQQMLNTRASAFLSLGDERKTIEEWSRQTGVNRRTITSRVQLGWDLKTALTTPGVRGRNNRPQEALGCDTMEDA